MSTHLPEDVLIEILSSLPVKSLVRFRCVCKSWSSLITNPNFIAQHLHNNSNSNSNINSKDHLLVSHCITKKPLLSSLSCSHENAALAADDAVFSLNLLDLPSYRGKEDKEHCPIIFGPCNGIFCLYGDSIVFLNPAIREFKALPLSPFPRPPGTLVKFELPGFGFDPKTNDFKLVMIISLYHVEKISVIDRLLIEVYNLSTDSWRRIDAVVPLRPTFLSRYPLTNTYLNGAFYWWINDHNVDGGAAILSFDMGDEVFCKTPVPERVSMDGRATIALFNESLAIVVSHDLRRCFDIWVMDKYGAEGEWTKKLIIGPLSGFVRLLGFWKNGAVLLKYKATDLVLYDPIAQVIKNLRVNGLNDSFQVVNYAESLVSVMGGNEIRQQSNSFDILQDPFFSAMPCSVLNQTDFEPTRIEKCLKFLSSLKSLFCGKYHFAS